MESNDLAADSRWVTEVVHCERTASRRDCVCRIPLKRHSRFEGGGIREVMHRFLVHDHGESRRKR